MKRVILSGLMTILVAGACVGARGSESKREKAALSVARAWLALTDSGDYAKAWKTGAAYMKGAVTEEQFTAALAAARGPLGALKERKLASSTYRTELPGAPDGEYVVLQFETSFENKAQAVETVTPMREKDGTWRVSGYYIK